MQKPGRVMIPLDLCCLFCAAALLPYFNLAHPPSPPRASTASLQNPTSMQYCTGAKNNARDMSMIMSHRSSVAAMVVAEDTTKLSACFLWLILCLCWGS